MEFSELKELNFLDSSPDEIYSDLKTSAEELLGRSISKADPFNLFLHKVLAEIVRLRELINEKMRQNFLAYATDYQLEHFGIFVNTERLPASKATCKVQVNLSSPREKVTVIKKGTRINAGDEVNFALDDDVVFQVGETEKIVSASCVEVGEVGNNYAVGELNKIVDPQAFLQSITNITETAGGADVESDDDYRERIRLTPESFSVAGSEQAYIFHTKKVSALIEDVAVTSDQPGEVDIYPLLKNGELPNSEMLDKIYTYLSDKKVRPLTDHVFVRTPQIKSYNVEVNYKISQSSNNEAEIISNVTQAVNDYILWQKSKLGRDINPTELIYRLKQAGLKRADVVQPVFTSLDNFEVAIADSVSVNYFGTEED